MKTWTWLTLGVVALGGAAAIAHEAPRCGLAELDRASATSAHCVGCHNGTTAGPHAPSGRGSHSVDINYEEHRARRPEELRASLDLPPALVLNQGTLTCSTCHDGASPERFRLALPMGQAQLCRACHDPR